MQKWQDCYRPGLEKGIELIMKESLLQNIILKWETKLATKEIEDDRKEITIDNARTRLEQMSVITHDPISD